MSGVLITRNDIVDLTISQALRELSIPGERRYVAQLGQVTADNVSVITVD